MQPGKHDEPFGALMDMVDWKPFVNQEFVSGLYATHCGELNIAGHRFICYKLSDGQRVFDANCVAEFFENGDTDSLKFHLSRQLG